MRLLRLIGKQITMAFLGLTSEQYDNNIRVKKVTRKYNNFW